MLPDSDQEKAPDLGHEIKGRGVELLPVKVLRYGTAKIRALDVAHYIARLPLDLRDSYTAERLYACGNNLHFRHYFTIDEVRLHKSYLCGFHLLCPLCAIRRGSKALQAYLPRYEALVASEPLLKPFLVTLTVKDGPDLEERFDHLLLAQNRLWRSKLGTRQKCSLSGVRAAVWSYEVKRGKGSGLWHPHLHMVALAETMPDQVSLARQWKQLTGDSHVVDVRPIDQADPVSGFLEVFKYALKFSDMSEEDTFHAFTVLSGRRLIGSSGKFRGVKIPKSLMDEPLDSLPYVEYLYRWLPQRRGYRAPLISEPVFPATPAAPLADALRPGFRLPDSSTKPRGLDYRLRRGT